MHYREHRTSKITEYRISLLILFSIVFQIAEYLFMSSLGKPPTIEDYRTFKILKNCRVLFSLLNRLFFSQNYRLEILKNSNKISTIVHYLFN